MKTLKFYKEDSGGWYIDLPEYIGFKYPGPHGWDNEGKKEDLQMSLGADKFLDLLSGGGEEVTLLATSQLSDLREHENTPAFVPVPKGWEWLSRADNIPVADGKYYVGYNAHYMWLRDVVMFIFGDFPRFIYYKIVKT